MSVKNDWDNKTNNEAGVHYIYGFTNDTTHTDQANDEMAFFRKKRVPVEIDGVIVPNQYSTVSTSLWNFEKGEFIIDNTLDQRLDDPKILWTEVEEKEFFDILESVIKEFECDKHSLENYDPPPDIT